MISHCKAYENFKLFSELITVHLVLKRKNKFEFVANSLPTIHTVFANCYCPHFFLFVFENFLSCVKRDKCCVVKLLRFSEWYRINYLVHGNLKQFRNDLNGPPPCLEKWGKSEGILFGDHKTTPYNEKQLHSEISCRFLYCLNYPVQSTLALRTPCYYGHPANTDCS